MFLGWSATFRFPWLRVGGRGSDQSGTSLCCDGALSCIFFGHRANHQQDLCIKLQSTNNILHNITHRDLNVFECIWMYLNVLKGSLNWCWFLIFAVVFGGRHCCVSKPRHTNGTTHRWRTTISCWELRIAMSISNTQHVDMGLFQNWVPSDLILYHHSMKIATF